MNKTVKEILSWFSYIAGAVVLGLLLNNFVLAAAVVDSASMENTIMTNSRVMGLRVAYVFNDPERFDIILFESPFEYEPTPFVKRIIGLPNETINIVGGKVFIDGAHEPLYEPYLIFEPQGNFGPFIVPEGEFFVMGDNRNISNDSRHWGFVPRGDIIGRLYFEFFPSLTWLN